MNDPFDLGTLADDLEEVRRIYAALFAGVDAVVWDKPVQRGAQEWTLHETVAHLCALTGAGLESMRAAVRGETYVFPGLQNRYQFNAFNRRGIDAHLSLPRQDLCAAFLDRLAAASTLARSLPPGRAHVVSAMPIYNRPVQIAEGLGIIMLHAGLVHAAQVAEPAGVPPLWQHLAPDMRHRVIGRMMRALSLLYRPDLGGHLTAVVAFRVDGPGGGAWHVDVAPQTAMSAEGAVDHATLTVHVSDTATYCRMVTGRLHLPVALVTGHVRVRGDLRLFVRMSTLFSVEARPKVAA